MWPSYTNIKGLPRKRGTINIKDSKYQIQRGHKGEGRNKRLVLTIYEQNGIGHHVKLQVVIQRI
jgi:hypothetical protein